MISNSTSGFFRTLGQLAGTRQQENQLSRTFQACFSASPGFRNSVLKMLCRECQAHANVSAEWTCAVDLAGPNGGRPDLRISSTQRGQPVFVLESKVGSKLREEQLLRYRTRKNDEMTFIVAITKNRPEVAPRALRRVRVDSVRWQDIHRALNDQTVHNPVDRFIASSFVVYLEDSDMAYREQLTVSDLENAARLLRAIHHESDGMATKDGFDTLNSCACVLKDICSDVREEFSTLKRMGRWGPKYFCWAKGEDGPGREHEIGSGLWREVGKKEDGLGWSFLFSADTAYSTQWSVWRYEENERLSSFDRDIRRFFTRGVLDSNKLVQSVRHQAKKWKFV